MLPGVDRALLVNKAQDLGTTQEARAHGPARAGYGHKQGLSAPLPFWLVDDINKALEQLVAVGATVQQQPRNIGGGSLMARVKDADGNVTGLLQKP